MKHLFYALILLISLSPIAQAHGGVEKRVGDVTVVLTQEPLSPLVGENVAMTFVLSDNDNNRLKNFPVTLRVIDTYRGDESKDKTIAEVTLKTDDNGVLEYDHTFNKENYFDIELEFADPVTHETESTGFLIQPRYIADKFKLSSLFLAALIGFSLRGLLAIRRK